MKLMKGLLSAFAVVLATTACAGNSGENKKSNESTKEDNKIKYIIMKPIRTIGNLRAAVLLS